MKITFFSNFLNHHQLPLCQEFCKKEGVEFIFVATEPIPQDRLDMGYENMNEMYDFVLRAYENQSSLQRAEILAKECEIMIFGAAPLSYLEIRMLADKPAFYFTERILRKGYWRRFIPTTRKKINAGYVRYKYKPLYILGASAYASYDLKLCGFDPDKCFKWGYFPEVRACGIEQLLQKKRENSRVEILYAGRLLNLKRVLDTVKALKLLVKNGVTNFCFTIIGDGEQKTQIEKYVKKHRMEQYIRLLPFVPAKEVRQYMDSADIYVFSSNFYEGWGAVVNEAMDSACAMVVSHAVGSAPYLIENGKNGLIYPCGDVKRLAAVLNSLISDVVYRESLATEAYKTITQKWTAQVAADRLLQLYSSIKSGDTCYVPFSEGICSRAEPLKNNWIGRTNGNK